MTDAPILLNAEQEHAAKEWAADDRLWTTQETVEFNLRTFARVILKADLQSEVAVGTLQAALRQYQQSFALCEVHTPDSWEGDGTCVLCEAVHQHDQLTALQTALRQQIEKLRAYPIQGVGMIPRSVAERAYARYAQLYGRSQSFERLAERGGFGLAELGFLLRGYERRQDSREDDRYWQHACEFATKEILRAYTSELLALLPALEPTP